MDVVHYLLKNNASTEIGNKVNDILFLILIFQIVRLNSSFPRMLERLFKNSLTFIGF